jgi:hypothetical protein
MDKILESILKNLLPENIYLHFGIVSLIEKPHGFEMRLDEYAELLPKEIGDKGTVVLDGFCNPIELLHFSIKGKPLYLQIYRRRWKESGSNNHHSNQYDLHSEGVKATHEFAIFLKGEAGCTTDEYVRFLLNIKP